mmetsp:Transcript_27296/g.49591  ORF Transcript_27296/g.49591 Transcript_27296/m.49591 type:complete len:290 (+) Transcript_27296:22-891(+)
MVYLAYTAKTFVKFRHYEVFAHSFACVLFSKKQSKLLEIRWNGYYWRSCLDLVFVEFVKFHKHGKTVSTIHIFKGIKNTAFAAIFHFDTGIHRPFLNGFLRKSCGDQRLSKAIAGKGDIQPVIFLSKSLKRRGRGMNSIISLVGFRRESQLLVRLKDSFADRSIRSVRWIGRSEKVVAEIRPGESRRVPFDSVAVNAIVGSDEFGTHAHEKGIKDVERIVVAHGHKSAVKASTKFHHLGRFGPSFIQRSRITSKLFACIHGIDSLSLLERVSPFESKLRLELVRRYRDF